MNKPTDTTTGLTNVGARYLDTSIGRFICLDPVLEIADTLALNGYGYTSDNPVNSVDPSGETSCDETDCHHGGPHSPDATKDEDQTDVLAAEDSDIEHGCRGGGECELHVINHYETDAEYAARQTAIKTSLEASYGTGKVARNALRVIESQVKEAPVLAQRSAEQAENKRYYLWLDRCVDK